MCNFSTIPESVDATYQLYKTTKGLTPYYAKCKNIPKFYLIDYAIGDEKCKELSYPEYLDMELKQKLIEIPAKEVDEVLLNAFFPYINKQEE